MSSRANYYAKTVSLCPNGEQITRSEKFVLMVLADAHQDGAHLRTYPKVATIAEDAMVSERQCQRIFASLERKGVLRREYPNGTGRDRLTFYFFPELDDAGRALPVVKKPTAKRADGVKKNSNKGDILSPLFEQEGCQKGDRRVTSGAPQLITINESNKSKSLPPTSPTSGGSGVLKVSTAVKHPAQGAAADRVMRECGFVRRRLRPVVLDAIVRACDAGELADEVATRMVEAWKTQILRNNEGLLRVRMGPDKFFGDGIWLDLGGLHWDHEAIERRKNARVGMGSY